ncbi:hypothetical protein RN001_009520 [Aquatica leii]|uniref:Large ribosomal subunit protein mL42 n=1 Tax=Aquatica leii TaxID=1421715 RepID=A0AAN7P4W4_9COLE|nr:hypothetical protein RN001_009520 [Aquatica leii]
MNTVRTIYKNTVKSSLIRLYSVRTNAPSTIVLTDDGSTFVAWHPKQDFPYECTKPLPESKVTETTSVLKTQMTSEVMEIFKKKTPEQARQELMNITHTTKHRWFPRARDKRAKKTPMDREYL